MNLQQPIHATGIESIQLLDSLFSIREHIIQNEADWEASLASWIPDFMSYTYKNSLEVIVNVHLGCITTLKFKGNYRGKLWGKVGIGDTVQTLMNHQDNISFDEEFLLIGNNYDLLIEIDNDRQSIDHLETVKDHKITVISVSNEAYDGVTVSTAQFPPHWKKFLVKKYS